MSNSAAIRIRALWHMGLAVADESIRWAQDQLEAGEDSPSLRILAGIVTPSTRAEVERYLPKAMVETGCGWPDEKAALAAYLHDIAEQIVAGAQPTDEGCATIYEIYVALGYPRVLDPWLSLAEDRDPDNNWHLEPADFDQAVKREASRLSKISSTELGAALKTTGR